MEVGRELPAGECREVRLDALPAWGECHVSARWRRASSTRVRHSLESGVLQETIDVGVELPSDATFGGPDLDRMYVVSIAVSIDGNPITAPHAGALMAVDGSGFRGRPEPRMCL